MPLYEPYLPTRYIVPLFVMLSKQAPQCLTRILARAELAYEQLTAHDSLVTFREFERLLNAASEELQRDDLGFELGQRISIDDHAALGFVLRQCSTADQLLRLVARYRRVVTTGMFFHYERHASYAEMIIRPAAAMGTKTLHAFEELLAVSFHSDMTALLAQAPGLEIFLSMPKPVHVERYRALRPTRFHFGANALPEVRCRLPAHLLDMALVQPGHRPTHRTATLSQADSAHADSNEYSQWVAMIVREAEGIQPSLSDLASMLYISERTLNRCLMAEGTCLRDLNTAVRFERAKMLLARSNESIGQIAYRLGYASPTSFHNAFYKCAGLGPRAHRTQLAAASLARAAEEKSRSKP